MSADEIARQVFEILQEFVVRVRSRVPRSVGGAMFHGVDAHGLRSPYASFSLTGRDDEFGDDELVLMVDMRTTSAGLECSADFGPNKENFGEMPLVTVQDHEDLGQVEALLQTVRDFASSQEDRAVRELERDARLGGA